MRKKRCEKERGRKRKRDRKREGGNFKRKKAVKQ